MDTQKKIPMQDVAVIQKHIISVRNVHAILDRDLAAMYGVEVKQLNRQVKRNIERFPSDFMFQLSKEECTRCQIGTLYERGEKTLNWSTYRPYVFTENGVAMTDFSSSTMLNCMASARPSTALADASLHTPPAM